ncbi:MAG: kinase [Zetaproteobacteria bacterium]|nr:kinase [Zetaproteobacteria bacterium]
MIMTRTPFRISFFGGGTDYPAWYMEHGGTTIATTIDKYCYITCRKLPPFFEYKHRIVYSNTECVSRIDEINHPSVRECLRYFRFDDLDIGLEIHHDGDLPARSGLGSSSAFTVGLLQALYALGGKTITKLELAKLAIEIEQNWSKENVGSQDQTCAAFGGLNKLNFHRNGELSVDPVIIPPQVEQDLEKHCMLYFTGFSRIASDIAGEQIKTTQQKHLELRRMHTMVEEAISILSADSVSMQDFGQLLNEAWMIKRSLTSRISTHKIDEMYTSAINAGAWGGKLLGAGGGGFMLLFVAPEKQESVAQALSSLMRVNFKFEKLGSTISVYQPNMDGGYHDQRSITHTV